MFILSDGAVMWCSKRQASVALSTVESEYMALSLATQEAVWLRRLVEEMGNSDQEVFVLVAQTFVICKFITQYKI